MRAYRTAAWSLIVLAAVQSHRAEAQFGPEPSPPKGPPPWSSQLPGYWASLITEDWRLRMVTPAKGDYIGIPLNAAAAKIADAWDPAKDAAQGLQCKAYGAAGIMFRPETLHLLWRDDHTLEMQIDDGMQTRLLHFEASAPPDVAPSWQGYSTARWSPRSSEGYQYGSNARYLSVTTTHMIPGYLRQNGVPYSGNAVLDEAYDLLHVSDQEIYLIVTTRVTDPTFLDYPLTLSAIFQRQSDGTHWDPTPCSSTW